MGVVVRRRPTLPPRLRGSTIGAERLSFRVRNGTGRFPLAMAAVTLRTGRPGRGPPGGGGRGVGAFRTAQWTRGWCSDLLDPARTGVRGAEWRSCGQALGLLVPVSSHTSRCFHLRPINPLVWAGALPH